jgi:hypothetical protein
MWKFDAMEKWQDVPKIDALLNLTSLVKARATRH